MALLTQFRDARGGSAGRIVMGLAMTFLKAIERATRFWKVDGPCILQWMLCQPWPGDDAAKLRVPSLRSKNFGLCSSMSSFIP